jgi:hypothetical protein
MSKKKKAKPDDRPRQLALWMYRHRKWWRSGYRTALAGGYPVDSVVWGTPATDRVADPPVGFDIQGPAESASNGWAVVSDEEPDQEEEEGQ